MQLSEGGGGVPMVDLTGEVEVEEAAEESEEEEINIQVAARRQQKRPCAEAGPSSAGGAAAAEVEAEMEIETPLLASPPPPHTSSAGAAAAAEVEAEMEVEIPPLASPPPPRAPPPSLPLATLPPAGSSLASPPLLSSPSPPSLPLVGSHLRIDTHPLAAGEWVSFQVLEVNTFGGEVQHRLRCEQEGLQVDGKDGQHGEWYSLSECRWEAVATGTVGDGSSQPTQPW